ncbi:MAG: [protein-PII] uridylyltransferase family protein [Ferrimicrobium sp.]
MSFAYEPKNEALTQCKDALIAARDASRCYSERGNAWALRFSTAIEAAIEAVVPDGAPIVLLGLGSLATRSMTAYSDLDLTIVYRARVQRQALEIAERLWYNVWDAGFQLDHSVRTIAEVNRAMRDDPRVLMGLLDARALSGDAELGALIRNQATTRWGRQWRSILPELEAERHTRLLRYGDVAGVGEPELKHGVGGLRDLTVLSALGVSCELSKSDLNHIAATHALVASVRIELHRIAGRPREYLSFADRDEVAQQLGFREPWQLSRMLNRALQRTFWLQEELLDRSLTKQNTGHTTKVHLGTTVWNREQHGNRYLVKLPISPLPSRADALAMIAAGIHDGLLPSLGAAKVMTTLPMEEPPGELSPSEHASFLTLLTSGALLRPTVEILTTAEMFWRIFPPWAHANGLAQPNPYHRFSLDRHLLGTVLEASLLRREVHRPDLLVVAAFLHDLAKGLGGDHGEVGAARALIWGTYLGFSTDDSAILARLVRHHLLLVHTALRRDCHDPATIKEVAQAVKDRGTLALLTALTKADSLATGVLSWSASKDALIQELVAQVARALDGEEIVPRSARLPQEIRNRLINEGRNAPIILEWEGRIVVGAPDRPGILASITGSLLADHLDVVAADAEVVDGVALEVLFVTPRRRVSISSEHVHAALRNGLAHPEHVADRVNKMKLTYARELTGSCENAQVLGTTNHSGSATVIEVRAGDRLGLLHELVEAIAAFGCNISAARVETLGTDVVDTFFIDRKGVALLDKERDRIIGLLVAVAEGTLDLAL